MVERLRSLLYFHNTDRNVLPKRIRDDNDDDEDDDDDGSVVLRILKINIIFEKINIY
jgi:hypothetical protein